MPDAFISTSTESAFKPAPNDLSVRAAKSLVTFIFGINVLFSIYMVTQFFVSKPHGNGLHALYLIVVLATTMLLGVSTRRFWSGATNQGTHLFFGALFISFLGNLVAQYFS